MTPARMGMAALAGAALFGAGALVGLAAARRAPERTPPLAGVRPAATAVRGAESLSPARQATKRNPNSASPVPGGAGRAGAGTHAHPDTHAHAGAGAGAGDSGAGEAEEGASFRSLTLDEALAKIAAGEDAAWVAKITGARLRRDRAALDEALARFRSESDPAALERLAFILGEAEAPEAEAAALDLARRGDDVHRRAALSVLERLEAPAAIPVAAEIIRSERDPGLVAAAIHALPEPRGAAGDQARAVAADLRAAAASADPEVRRRALIALASWTPPAEAEPLLAGALRDDPEAAVRAGAAYALEVVRPRLPATIALLAATVARRDEDRLVRENAWRALGAAGPLPSEAASVYRMFEEEREGQ